MKKIYLLLSFLVFCICEAQNPAQLDVNFDYKDNVSLIHHQPRKIVELQFSQLIVRGESVYVSLMALTITESVSGSYIPNRYFF